MRARRYVIVAVTRASFQLGRWAVSFAALALGLSMAQTSAAQSSMVRINATARPVFYNDGDTFRVLAGPLRQRSARLAGFNTLESYGSVHRWGGWTAHELYANAKQATLNARRGKWSCQINPSEKDGYGRLLAVCPDLAADQIRKGLAHGLSVAGPSPWPLIRAQRRAIVERRGMWAKGVPALVLTSLHSVNERFDNADNYNRLVSPLDGVSTKWKHQELYRECQEVCFRAKAAERAGLSAVIAALRADDATADVIKQIEDPYLFVVLDEYVATGRVAQVFKRDGHKAVKSKLDALLAAGAFGPLEDKNVSCMVYVTFERRYRPPKAECLK